MPNKNASSWLTECQTFFGPITRFAGCRILKGLPTNSTYGFTVTLRKLIKDHRPDYLGVVLDSKEMTFARNSTPITRLTVQICPKTLVAQLPYILRVCEALRVPVLRIPLLRSRRHPRRARQTGHRSRPAIGRRHERQRPRQLVRDDEVPMLRMDKNGENLLNEDGVKAKYGVRPDQIVDWLVDGRRGGRHSRRARHRRKRRGRCCSRSSTRSITRSQIGNRSRRRPIANRCAITPIRFASHATLRASISTSRSNSTWGR